ncbi:MAG: SRPBCC domain-containing protein [Cyanobacteria bacterium J06632_22]
MKIYSVTAIIHASPAVIWSLLTDSRRYPEWNTTVNRIEGTIALGEQIKVYAKISPDRAFPVKVTAFESEQAMIWQSGMPLGLFKGVRTYRLTPEANNNGGPVEFHMSEVFSGLLSPLILPSIPDLTEPFEAFAACLKAKAEGV